VETNLPTPILYVNLLEGSLREKCRNNLSLWENFRAGNDGVFGRLVAINGNV